MAFAAWIKATENDLPLQRAYRWERERPGAAFLTQPMGGKARSWNWGQAMNEARRMAAWLGAQGWEPGSRIAILSKNCAWWIMADLATWMAGHVSVPVYPSLRPESARQIIEHSGARACFVGATDDPTSVTAAIPDGVEVIAFPTAPPTGAASWDHIVSESAPLAGSPTPEGDRLATIIYTSGTTGVPKGVMHRFSAFSHLTLMAARLLNLSAEDRMFSYLPLAHIVERSGMEMLTFFLGSQIYFTEGLDTFLADLHRAKPTLFLSVPRLLFKFQQGVFEKVRKERLDRLLGTAILSRFIKRRILKQLGLDTVRFAACGAAPLPPELLLWYRGLGLELSEGYGMTEVLITHLGLPGDVHPGCVGVPIPGVETRLGDDNELLLRSPMNMMGYYNAPEATKQSFTEDGFFRTGDVASIDPDGQLRIVGRLKEQFKTSKGKYVAPSPIESRLGAHPAVESCCLMGSGMASPFAIVVLTPQAKEMCRDQAGREAIERTLIEHLDATNTALDSFERVAFIVVAQDPWTVTNGLLTPTLKIRRHALEGRYLGQVEKWRNAGRGVVWESAEVSQPVGAAQSQSPVSRQG